MSDREKVIKGLEKIAEFFKARGDMAVGDGKMLLSWMRAVEDAIALLKAQEPRVLTLEGAYPEIEYGRTWRAWYIEPTAKQREKAPWQA